MMREVKSGYESRTKYKKFASGTSLYYMWRNMKRRCEDNRDRSYKWYGERGIVVDNEWQEFENFASWALDNGYDEGLEIDRIDNDGNYTMTNVRFVSSVVNHNNRSDNVSIEYRGYTYSISELGELFGASKLEVARAYKRHSNYGATTAEELFTPHLRSYRAENRENRCLICFTESSAKWRKDGKCCNTCWHRAYRWAKTTNSHIDDYDEFIVFKSMIHKRQGVLPC